MIYDQDSGSCSYFAQTFSKFVKVFYLVFVHIIQDMISLDGSEGFFLQYKDQRIMIEFTGINISYKVTKSCFEPFYKIPVLYTVGL